MRTICVAAMFVRAIIAADPALTIYNQDFAVIRDTLPLDLHKGENAISYNGITAHLEPESVILRDVSGRVPFRILEQNYRADPVSAGLLLSLFEGKTIQFEVPHGDRVELVEGRIVRSGYQPAGGVPETPIIEVSGKLQFSLPGEPLFPELDGDTILKPAINWVIQSDRDAKITAELAYVSQGMTWAADYNVISSAGQPDVDIVGWVTLHNRTGKSFENARIKLMAGDVNKVKQMRFRPPGMKFKDMDMVFKAEAVVTEKSFDEYHLYTLERPATLHDQETKQVEFLRANSVAAEQIYIYDGYKPDPGRNGWNAESIRQDVSYGTISNNKVWAMREIRNSEANHLGIPLPGGRVRFYRRDNDGQLEFTGEDNIQHTPKDETVRVFTGSAFDLTGERKRVNYSLDANALRLDESFEIKLRNHKKEPAEIRVVEHLYRWSNWDIQLASTPYAKTDAQTIEFRVTLAPGEERTVTYNAHYTW